MPSIYSDFPPSYLVFHMGNLDWGTATSSNYSRGVVALWVVYADSARERSISSAVWRLWQWCPRVVQMWTVRQHIPLSAITYRRAWWRHNMLTLSVLLALFQGIYRLLQSSQSSIYFHCFWSLIYFLVCENPYFLFTPDALFAFLRWFHFFVERFRYVLV